MADIILIYASMTGNTEEMAEAVAEGVRLEGGELVVKEAFSADAGDLERYDGILLGSYTWGDGELPDELLDFCDELNDMRLEGKKAAVFGSGDSCYAAFAAAVDILIDRLQQSGAEIVAPGLKIELSPSAQEKELCRQFGRQFARSLAEAR